MNLDELKEEAQRLGHTTICRDHPNAKPVPLKTWNGFSPYLGAHMTASVECFIEDDKVRVHKTLEGDFWYTLGNG